MGTSARGQMAIDAEVALTLSTGSFEVVGRLVDSSNNALVVRTALGGQALTAVYKPAAGERPLWDFPDATLGRREVAAYLLSEHLGWGLVPLTVWREDGPGGPGMVQRWIEGDEATSFINLFGPQEVPVGWFPILEGRDATNEAVVLAHSDSPQLQRMAVFDVLANNADRKGGHLIATGESQVERVWAIDHGITFHTEPKLRTVLWGFAGRPLSAALLADVEAFVEDFSAFREQVSAHLDPDEVEVVRARARRLLESGEFPGPSGDGPAVPWPIF